MSQSSAAGIITAIATVFMSVSVVIGSLTLFLPVLRKVKEGNRLTAKNNELTSEAIEKVDEVHHIVNQQRTDAMNYQRALIRALEAHGVQVPLDQSLDQSGDEQAQAQALARPVGGAIKRIEDAAASVEAVASDLHGAIEEHNVDETSHEHPHENGTTHTL